MLHNTHLTLYIRTLFTLDFDPLLTQGFTWSFYNYYGEDKKKQAAITAFFVEEV